VSGEYPVANPTQAVKLAGKLFHTLSEGRDPYCEDKWAVTLAEPRKVVWTQDLSGWVAVSLLDGVQRGAYGALADKEHVVLTRAREAMLLRTPLQSIPGLEDRIQAMYARVPEDTKENIGEAYAWATKTLTEHEGAGHQIFVTAGRGRTVVCSFAKPAWPGDHSGRGMDHASEAIVMAVCEYLCGA
jgi:hypothetical protein